MPYSQCDLVDFIVIYKKHLLNLFEMMDGMALTLVLYQSLYSK